MSLATMIIFQPNRLHFCICALLCYSPNSIFRMASSFVLPNNPSFLSRHEHTNRIHFHVDRRDLTPTTFTYKAGSDDNNNSNNMDDINDDNNDDNEENKEGEGEIYYNDFDDFSSSSSPVFFQETSISSSTTSLPEQKESTEGDNSNDDVLTKLLVQSQQIEQQNQKRITQNWQQGNWKVRGFSLDSETVNIKSTSRHSDTTSDGSAAASPSTPPPPINVCKIAFDETLYGNNFGDVAETIAVGRSDGSIYIMQLGSDYLTKFKSVPKMITNDVSSSSSGSIGDNEEEKDSLSTTLRIESELVRDDQIYKPQTNDNEYDDDNDELYSTPCEILHQFQAHGKNQPISSLLFFDETLYTSGGTSGEIKVWSLDDDGSNGLQMIPIRNLNHVHTETVICIKTLASSAVSKDGNGYDVNEHDLLLSASSDGSFALWSRNDGDLVYRCQLTDDTGMPTSITCADIDTSGDEHFIYLGLASGYVVAYGTSDLIGCASAGYECPIPSCRFMAHDPSQQKNEENEHEDNTGDNNDNSQGITSISCGKKDPSSTSSSSSTQNTDIIITGGADGIIKQWQILKRGGNNEEGSSTPSRRKLEHWPRMPTQRMRNYAHIFKGHFGAVTALASVNGSEILSASLDGTLRIWEVGKGKELYRMDGFVEKVSSLCFDREVLVTDGMGHFVCVHDFDISEDEWKDGYELEW